MIFQKILLSAYAKMIKAMQNEKRHYQKQFCPLAPLEDLLYDAQQQVC